MNLKKDIARGQMNRVADGASVLQNGDSPEDHAHVKQSKPLTLRKRELGDGRTPDIDAAREQYTSRRRSAKDVRPL